MPIGPREGTADMAGKATDTGTREIVSSHQYPEMRATPAEGCDVCGALAKQYATSKDRDLLIEINNHPHTEPKLSRVRAWKQEGAKTG
ncbi:hypothetical protein [Streptomyces sp. NPDC003077]|uniref:hypothetical protein n=1 Tax=Streptomyces sp. NPDC003077 TaxID=3154443 RepID=UPI00339EAFED